MIETVTAVAEASIAAPPTAVYDRLTRFEALPEFMEGVRRVEAVDDRTLRFVASDRDVEWEADVIDRVPNRRVAWVSRTGPIADVMVQLRPVHDGATKVIVMAEMEPVSGAADPAAALTQRLEDDLERLRGLVESGS